MFRVAFEVGRAEVGVREMGREEVERDVVGGKRGERRCGMLLERWVMGVGERRKERERRVRVSQTRDWELMVRAGTRRRRRQPSRFLLQLRTAVFLCNTSRFYLLLCSRLLLPPSSSPSQRQAPFSRKHTSQNGVPVLQHSKTNLGVLNLACCPLLKQLLPSFRFRGARSPFFRTGREKS